MTGEVQGIFLPGNIFNFDVGQLLTFSFFKDDFDEFFQCENMDFLRFKGLIGFDPRFRYSHSYSRLTKA